MRKIAILLTLLLISISILTGCSAEKTGGSVVIAIPTDPDGFHPHHSVAAATGEIAFNIYEGLVKAGPDGSIVPALAESWDISEDGLTYVFTLRQGVKFHNGRELTPEDVIYSLGRLIDPDISNRAQDYSAVDSISNDGWDIIIELNRNDAAFLAMLTRTGAAIYPQEAEDQLNTNPVGTGPFELTQWQPNNQLVLTRFEDYWGELPYIEEAVLQIIPEPTTAVTNLKTGHVDIIPRLEPDHLHQVENDPNLKIVDSPMNLVQLLAINNSRAPFDDIRVRQALNHAINRDQIIQGAAWGRGNAIGSNLSPAMDAWYVDLTQYYPYDPQKAKELLAEAGYPDGFSATIHLPAPYPLHRNAGEIIADQLSNIGVDLDIQVIEWGTWLEQVYSNSDFDLTVIGFTGSLDPHTILNRYLTGSSRNFIKFDNAEYDELVQRGIEETDIDVRIEIYQRIQEVLVEQASNVYIMDPNQLAVMQSDIEGWVNYPIYVLDLSRIRRGQ